MPLLYIVLVAGLWPCAMPFTAHMLTLLPALQARMLYDEADRELTAGWMTEADGCLSRPLPQGLHTMCALDYTATARGFAKFAGM